MADYIARLCSDDDLRKLNGLYERSPQYLCQHPAFCKVVHPDGFHIGVFKDQELLCAMAFVPQKGKLEKRWISPFFSPFSGPLADEYYYENNKTSEKFWRDVWKALLDFKGKVPDYISMTTPPGVIDCRELIWNDWEVTPHYNYISRWEKDEEWLEIWDNSARRQVSKAQEKENLRDIVHVSTKTEDLKKLWVINAKHQGLDSSLADTVESLGNWLDQLELGFVINIEDASGAVHASGLFGFDAHRVYYLVGASNPNFHGSGAPSLLHARAMQEIDRRQLPKVYDWVGANTPNIVSFKQSFAPKLEMLLRVQKRGRKSNLIKALKR